MSYRIKSFNININININTKFTLFKENIQKPKVSN